MNRILESFKLITSKTNKISFTSVLRHFFGYEDRQIHKQRSATIFKNNYLSSEKLERDYFKLKKIIIVSTLSGIILI